MTVINCFSLPHCPHLLGQVAEAQLLHLAAVTETHLARYHGAVSQAQTALLLQDGLDPQLLGCTPEELQAVLEQELQAEEWEPRSLMMQPCICVYFHFISNPNTGPWFSLLHIFHF